VRYLVTGGAGFIGSHLVQELNLKGFHISIIDNLSTGSYSNIKNISNLDFYSGDILDSRLLEKLIINSDQIIHLAAAVGVLNIVNNPLKSLLTNLHGTELVLKFASQYKKPVLLASTSEVYGKNEQNPLNEESDRIIGHPLLSRWSYSDAKAVDESLAYFYHQELNLQVRIVRLFNTVGPRQVGEYGMVLPRFISSALKNEPLTVYGSGEQIRCFCHVADVIKALLLVMDSDKSVGQVFNVGNNAQISIMELAKKVIEITGSKSSIQKIAYEKAYPKGFEDMQRRVPDISKIKQVLGWEPKINLDQIIKDIAAFNSK
jgi:UDP-glucose 4-epimerase